MRERNDATYAENKLRVAARAAPGDKLAYSVPEAAHALGISASTIWGMVRSGQIRKFKLGQRVLIKREELQRLISDAEAQEVHTQPEKKR